MTLQTWAHKFDPRVGRAKNRLAITPVAVTGHGVQVPWPWADKKIVKSKHHNKEINARIRTAPIVDVELHDPDLFAIQHSVKAGQVEWYLSHPNARDEGHMNEKSKTPDDLPVVLQQDGKRYIWDGHHRMTARFLLGAETVEARLVDFDE